MNTETYHKIRLSIKAEIKKLTQAHTSNKKAMKFNSRFCNKESGKHDPSAEPIHYISYNENFSKYGWCGEEEVLTTLHVFYNRFRNKKPHTSNDERYLRTSTYSKIEDLFCEKVEA